MNLLKIAGAGGAGDGKTVGVGRDGGEDAPDDTAGSAADGLQLGLREMTCRGRSRAWGVL